MRNTGITIGMIAISLGLASIGIDPNRNQANATTAALGTASLASTKIVSISSSSAGASSTLWGLAADGSLYRAEEVIRIPTEKPSPAAPSADSKAKERKMEEVQKIADRLINEIGQLQSRLRSAKGRSLQLLKERIAEKEKELAPFQEQIFSGMWESVAAIEKGLKENLPSLALDWVLVIPAK